MSFHLTAEYICLEEGHILRARLANEDGDYVDAQIDLDNYVGNNLGSFDWGGENFSHSAEDITFSLEGDDNVPILRAILGDGEGNQIPADLNLAERISKDNGEFNFCALLRQTLL
ncbi:Cyanovirin-N [Mariannaea sp. PMI_226]|nr:Cyanovirin-N [Mariannaea sp. PMI_226]